MAEGASDKMKDIDDLVDGFAKWTEEIKGKDNCPLKLKYANHGELLSVSKALSDILPPLGEDSLFDDIDDILYPDKKWSDFETSRTVFYEKELFERIDMCRYLTSYYLEVSKYNTCGNIICDYTLLKVVTHVPKYPGHLYDISKMLLDSGNERAVCFGLKFLRTVLKGNFAKSVQTRELCSLMSNYRDIPTKAIKDSNKERIADFIAKLAKGCYEEFAEKYKVPENKNQSSKRKITNSIHFIFYDCDDEMPICCRNILYNELTSVKNEETRIRYLEWLVRAIATSCIENLFEGFKVLANCLLENVLNSQSYIRENKLRLIDMNYGRKIEPYLPGVDVPIESEKLWNDENNEDETDYTFEKFFFYDEVMKNLHLLKIIYAAAAECNKKICEDDFDDKDYTEAFRDNERILEDFGYYLINKDVQVHWYMEKTLEMCPFIIFPHKDKDLAFDLIRVLRRDNDVSQNEKLSRKIKQMEDCYNKSLEPKGRKQFKKLPF